MSDDSTRPPDFAMLRAVEILAKIHEGARSRPNEPPAPLERAVLLHSPRISLELGVSTRKGVESELGIAFSYPARGWHTYGVSESGKLALLSLFYRSGTLVAGEFYLPRGDRTPRLAPRDLGGFALEPGGVRLGSSADAVSEYFSPAIGGPAKVVYDRSFEARFPGGVAYVMARKGTVERLALYADLPSAAVSVETTEG